MTETIQERINAQIRYAQGRIERATYKVEHDEWRTVLRLLEDIRDDYAKPPAFVETAIGAALVEAAKRGPGRPRKEQTAEPIT